MAKYINGKKIIYRALGYIEIGVAWLGDKLIYLNTSLIPEIIDFITRVEDDGGTVESPECIGSLDAEFVMYPAAYKSRKLYSQRRITPKPEEVDNTFIGGIGASITTKGQLATLLGLVEADIDEFRLEGLDVIAKINRNGIGDNYNIPQDAFNGNLEITSFYDNDSLVRVLNQASFQGTTNLEYVSFKGVTNLSTIGIFKSSGIKKADFGDFIGEFGREMFRSATSLNEIIGKPTIIQFYSLYGTASLRILDLSELTTIEDGGAAMRLCGLQGVLNFTKLTNVLGPSNFRQMAGVTHFNMPICTQLDTPTSASTFLACLQGVIVTVDRSMETNNSGNPDADLEYVINTFNGTVNYINN